MAELTKESQCSFSSRRNCANKILLGNFFRTMVWLRCLLSLQFASILCDLYAFPLVNYQCVWAVIFSVY